MDKYPPYIEDPFEEKEKRQKEALQKHIERMAGRPAFVGQSADLHTTPTPSVFKMCGGRGCGPPDDVSRNIRV